MTVVGGCIKIFLCNCVIFSFGFVINTREIYYVNSYFGESFKLEFGISDNGTGYIMVDGFGPWASFWPIWQNLIIRRENPLLPSNFSEIMCVEESMKKGDDLKLKKGKSKVLSHYNLHLSLSSSFEFSNLR